MHINKKSITSLLIAIASFGLLLQTAGCASGGYKLTRDFSRWVNKLHIVPRVVVYILTSPFFAGALLIDLVIFNTIDFWEGKVSAGEYHFNKDGKRYMVEHSWHGESLKKSAITVYSNKDNKKIQDILLVEKADSVIDVFIDGVRKAKIKDFKELPQLITYSRDGKIESTKYMKELLSKKTLASN